MSVNQNKWTSFIWPAGMLILSVVLAVIYHATVGSLIIAAVTYVACLVWLIKAVSDDNDNQWFPSAATAVAPIIIGVANGTNFFG